MRSAAVAATFALLALFATPGLAQDVDCHEDLEKAVELVDQRWSFKLFKPGAFDLEGAGERRGAYGGRFPTGGGVVRFSDK